VRLQILRKKCPCPSLRGEGVAVWLLEPRDFQAEETAPVVIAGPSQEEVSKFLVDELGPAAQARGDVVVVFSPEGPGGIMDALTEALHALFAELSLERPEANELTRWSMAVERATRKTIVDLRRRHLVVEDFDVIFRSSREARLRFTETLQRLARQRSIAVILGVEETKLEDCASLPGLAHAWTHRDLVPIVCRRDRVEDADWQPVLPERTAKSSHSLRPAERFAELCSVLDWRLWGPALGLATVAALGAWFFQPYVPTRTPTSDGAQSAELRRGGEGTSARAAVATEEERLPGLVPVNGVSEPGEGEGSDAAFSQEPTAR